MPYASPLPAGPPGELGPVLLVDASPDNRSLYHDYLEYVGGYAVCATANAAEALAALDVPPTPRVVIFDVVLPQVDGFALCAQLRQRPQCHDTALVAVTGYPLSASERQRLSDLGVAVVLPKPCAPDQLLAKVRQAIERSRVLRGVEQHERQRAEARRERTRALQAKAQQLRTYIAEVCQDEAYRTLYQRIQAEYREMPCLALSLGQAARLWNLPHDRCAVLFGDLVRDGFLRETSQRTYRRVGR